MMDFVYHVYEVEWPSRHATGPVRGVFGNFGAAEAYVGDSFTPNYERYMAIIKVQVRHEWPYDWYNPVVHNELTYYRQIGGKMVRFEPESEIQYHV